MSSSVLGLDVGGANLKAAHAGGAALSQPFALWKNPRGLTDGLARLMAQQPAFDRLAVTMTGELCDCFETKGQGVLAILNAVESAAAGKPVEVWRTDGTFVDLTEARRAPLQVAAANWLALATYAGGFAPQGSSLVIDIGSTTTDVVPLLNGKPVPRGFNDADRLRARELVYTGVRRTPVCALLGSEVTAELFATTLDAYLVLGNIMEDDTDCDTADGRPATKPAAHARLARMLGADPESCPEEHTRGLASAVRWRQIHVVRQAVDHVTDLLPEPLLQIILAGAGEFLAREVLQLAGEFLVPPISLAEKLGPEVSSCACAYAVAVLAAERFKQELDKSLSPVVLKVGGSLFDLRDLGSRLRSWIKQLGTSAVLIVPGGGPTADVVRELDRRHALGEEPAHWLALQALSLNASFLAEVIADAVVVQNLADCAAQWHASKIPILDPYPLILADEGRPGSLPHSWDVSSDSLAARVAGLVGARRLILLKSSIPAEPISWVEAGRGGFVDIHFAQAAAGLDVQAVDLRAWRP
jgi:probable H4MPT-linked C1 transfer pathway protein